MRHLTQSSGRMPGLGAVRLLLLPTCSSLHGWVAQGNMQKRGGAEVGKGALAVAAPWDMQGCGQGEGNQRALRGMQDAQTPQQWAGGDAWVTERRKVTTSRNVVTGKPRGCTRLAPGERPEEQHSHFSGPPRWEKRLTLLAVSLGVHHHHHGEHHAAG